MASGELFAECSFTLSEKVPGQDKKLMKKITDLGFSVNKVEPLTIKKGPSSSADIYGLLDVIYQAFEPQVGEDFEIIDCAPPEGYGVHQQVVSGFANKTESESKSTHQTGLVSSASVGGATGSDSAGLSSLGEGCIEELSMSLKSLDLTDREEEPSNTETETGRERVSRAHDITPNVQSVFSQSHLERVVYEPQGDPDLAELHKFAAPDTGYMKMRRVETKMHERDKTDVKKAPSIVKKEILSVFKMEKGVSTDICDGGSNNGTQSMMSAPAKAVQDDDSLKGDSELNSLGRSKTTQDSGLPHLQGSDRMESINTKEEYSTKFMSGNAKNKPCEIKTEFTTSSKKSIADNLKHSFQNNISRVDEIKAEIDGKKTSSTGPGPDIRPKHDKTCSEEEKMSFGSTSSTSELAKLGNAKEKRQHKKDKEGHSTSKTPFDGKEKSNVNRQGKNSSFSIENQRQDGNISYDDVIRKQTQQLKTGDEEETFYDCNDSLEFRVGKDIQSNSINATAVGKTTGRVSGQDKIKVNSNEERAQETAEQGSQEKLLGNTGTRQIGNDRWQQDENKFPCGDSRNLNRIGGNLGSSVKGRGSTGTQKTNLESVMNDLETNGASSDISKTARGEYDVERRADSKHTYGSTGFSQPSIVAAQTSHDEWQYPEDNKQKLQERPSVATPLQEKGLYPDLSKGKSSLIRGTKENKLHSVMGQTEPYRDRSTGLESIRPQSRNPETTGISQVDANAYFSHEQRSASSHPQHTAEGGIEPDRHSSPGRGSVLHFTDGESIAQRTGRNRLEPKRHRSHDGGSRHPQEPRDPDTTDMNGSSTCRHKGHEQGAALTDRETAKRYPPDVEMTDMTGGDSGIATGSAGAYNKPERQSGTSYHNFHDNERRQTRTKHSAEEHTEFRYSNQVEEDSDSSESDFENEQIYARTSSGEGGRKVVVKPNSMTVSRPTVNEMEKIANSSSKSRHDLQEGQYGKSVKEIKEIEIFCDVDSNYTLLSYIALLPSNMNLPNVEVFMDYVDKGFILVKGKPDEVDQIVDRTEKILRDKQNPSVRRSLQRGRNENTNPARWSSAGGSGEYSTTYFDSFGSEKQLSGGRSESDEKRKYGSSVDLMPPLSDNFLTKQNKIKVKVIKEDITVLKVDAIVNAANGRLRHGGGVARAIAEKAGQKLQQECIDYTKGEFKIPVTGLFVSTGGNLPAKHVFHAVGPRWDRYEDDKKGECARDLRWTVLKCLLEANVQGVRSIAIPSISAAIFKVPKEICTKAYLDAVKTYDLYPQTIRKNSVEQILFVDVMQDMVDCIQGRFTRDWTEELNLKQAHSDFEFAAKFKTQNRSTGHSSLQENYTETQTKKLYAGSQQSHQDRSQSPTRSRRPQSPTGSSRPQSPKRGQKVSENQVYAVGQSILRTTTGAALKQGAELIVVVGDLFKKLHDSPAFDVQHNLHQNSNLPYKKNSFISYGGSSSLPVIFHLMAYDYSQESINRAFNTLKEILYALETQLQPKSVVFTSSALYTSDYGAGAYPHQVDQKLVGAFARNVFEFLKSLRPSSGIFDVTIAAGADALPAVKKVLDSRTDATNKPEERAGRPKKTIETQKEDCGVCLNDKYERHNLTCCKGALCTTCVKKLQRCPFCQKPFLRMRGIQPHGRMKIDFRQYQKLKGYEKYGSYTITYEFPSGKQESEHPNPGKTYERVTREAYVPASDEGNRVLQLLRVAFLRRLTFTIGDSLTTGRKGVITWNDIHHKTSLKENSTYGYPDPQYLRMVTKELADRGVTMESVSREERRDLDKVERDLWASKFFLDFDNFKVKP